MVHFREEPGKQKTRSWRAQELARTVPRENERRKKGWLTELGASRVRTGAEGHSSLGKMVFETTFRFARSHRPSCGRKRKVCK